MALDNFGQTNNNELVHLTLQEKKDLAKKIKKLIEPDGASSTAMLKEIDIRRLISSETTADFITGRSEIVQILECNYSEKTIFRLMSKVEQCMVIDASVCNLSSKKLYELFSNGNIIITSLTISELQAIMHKKDVEDYSYANAKFLLLSFFDDAMSDLCIAAKIKKTTYVDTHLLDFCNKHGYGLYTYDLFMGFRAHSYHGISKIVLFNYVSTNHVYTPSYENNSTDILLDDDLASSDIQDIIATAESINGRRFILTRNFIEKVEDSGNRELAMFFLSDYNSEYTIYLDEKESAETIIELSKKFNAKILTSDTEKATSYKLIYFGNYKLVLPLESRNFLVDFIEKCTTDCSNTSSATASVSATTADTCFSDVSSEVTDSSSENKDKSTTTLEISSSKESPETESTTICSIPHYANQTNCISLRKIPLTEKVWVLDENGVQIIATSKSKIKLKSGYTIIHGTNNLNNLYIIKVLTVLGNKKSVLEYSCEFTSTTLNTVKKPYQSYANLLLMTT